MTVNRVILSVVAFALVSAPAMAQGDKALSPAAPPPAAKANEPATTGKATPAAAKVNLNTAPAAELQKLPKMTHARAKAIVDARTKAKFKDWDDFVARKVVPADAASALKDVAVF